MHNYILMGAQGSGKGTQARRLQTDLDLVHISVGDIFRWNIQNHTKLGSRIRRWVADGQLVPDSVVCEVIRTRLDQHDWNFGFLLDGFPRNRAQAEFYLENYAIDAVLLLDVADEVVMDRIANRRVCSGCGADYNLTYHPPAVPDTCNHCHGELMTRADDHPVAVRARLRDYHGKTLPAIDLFQNKGLVIRVDASAGADDIYANIRRELGLDSDESAMNACVGGLRESGRHG